MTNNFAAFFETLTSAAGEFNRAKVGRVALLDGVYLNVRSDAGRVGKTIQVPLPDVGPLKNVGNGQITADPANPNYVQLVFQNRVGKGLLFEDFEQWQTATELAEQFMDPLYKRAMEYLNGQISALVTPANFNFNAALQGASQGEIQVADQLAAWDVLADQKVPLEDPDMLSLFCHNNVYRKMLGDTAWVQENIVSAAIAQKAREQADLGNAFNFRPKWDQQMPASTGRIIYGQITVTQGSSDVTGVASAFTTDLAVGSWITFGCDSTKTPYQVSAIASDTALTLSANASIGQPNGATVTTSVRVINIIGGTVAVTNGSPTVTGTTTTFTTSLSVGNWLVFSCDPTNTPYQVQAIGSNTSLTLTGNYVGPTGTGATVTSKSYTCLAAHKYAIALALRPIYTPKEAQGVVAVSYLNLKGIPLRVMISYQHIYQGLFVTVDFGFAAAVIRPDFGVIINC